MQVYERRIDKCSMKIAASAVSILFDSTFDGYFRHFMGFLLRKTSPYRFKHKPSMGHLLSSIFLKCEKKIFRDLQPIKVI